MIETKSFKSNLDETGVLTLTLSRPDRINALTFEVYGELRDVFRHLKENEPDVRALVLEGEGPRGFCSGGDVNDIIAKLFDFLGWTQPWDETRVRDLPAHMLAADPRPTPGLLDIEDEPDRPHEDI